MRRATTADIPDPWEIREGENVQWGMPYSHGAWWDAKDNLFKLWYLGGIKANYAVSRDGIHWQKPKLDVIPGTNIVVDPGMFFRITTVITLTGGTMFLMWLGEQITSRGIGNGISLIIMAGIVAQLPTALAQLFEGGRTGSLNPAVILIIVAVEIKAPHAFEFAQFENAAAALSLSRAMMLRIRQSAAESYSSQKAFRRLPPWRVKSSAVSSSSPVSSRRYQRTPRTQLRAVTGPPPPTPSRSPPRRCGTRRTGPRSRAGARARGSP